MPHRPHPIPTSGSLILDLARLGAALSVVCGHFSHPSCSTIWGYHLDWALNGVAVFFVLSGFVIRLITTQRVMNARLYTNDRTTRIYSVLLPCILFTLIVSAVLHDHGPPPTVLTQVLANLTFTAQCWGLDLPVGGNSVFWSLSYECFFYLIYGIAFFGRGWPRILALVLAAALAGPPILIMLPLWLLGCLIHDLYQKLRPRPLAGILWTITACIALAATALALRHPLIHRARAIAPTLRPILTLAKSHNLHLLQRASPHFYVIGIPTAIVLLLLLLAVENLSIDRNHAATRFLRMAANGTFALYLLHVPLMSLAGSFIPYSRSSWPQVLSVLAAIVAVGIAAQLPMDRLKDRMRHGSHPS
jgi:peptidoglycan/LPS O-acetylase OafA/YrhL